MPLLNTSPVNAFARARARALTGEVLSIKTDQMTTQLAGPFGSRAVGVGDPVVQAAGVLADFVSREAYVLAYIDAFWLIAWVSLLGILLILLLRPPPPNLLIPSRRGL